MAKAICNHAGGPVGVDAEQHVADRYEVEHVHLGKRSLRIGEARAAGACPVPAPVVDGAPCHMNHGADHTAPEPR